MAVSFTMKHHQNRHASEFALQSKMDDFQNIRKIHQNLNLSVEPGKCHKLSLFQVIPRMSPFNVTPGDKEKATSSTSNLSRFFWRNYNSSSKWIGRWI